VIVRDFQWQKGRESFSDGSGIPMRNWIGKIGTVSLIFNLNFLASKQN
jgi:hypothetical protein